MTGSLESHGIDIKDDMKDWLKGQVEKVYQDTQSGLSDLKNKISNNTLEKEMNMKHVIDVIKNASNKFSSGESMQKVYGGTKTAGPEGMGAGLVLSLQIALKKIGKDTGPIDGMYGPQTKAAVEAFQVENSLEKDGRAGPATIAKILEKLETLPLSAEQKEKNKKLLAEIEAQYVLPKGDRTAEEKNDFVSTIPSTKFILTGKYDGKDLKISFDKEKTNFSSTIPSLSSNIKYINPTLISGQDSFELKENVLGPIIGKNDITLIPKKEEVTKPVKKIEKPNKPVVITTQKTPEKKEEKQTGSETITPTGEKHEQLKETTLDQLKKQYTITGLDGDLVQSGDIVDHKIKFIGKTTTGENIMIQFIVANDGKKYVSPGLVDRDLYYNLKIKPNTNPKLLEILPDNSEIVEKIRKNREIRTRLNNLEMPNNEWSKTEKPVDFSMVEPFDVKLKVKYNNQEYQINFDKDGKLIDGQEIVADGKSCIVTIANNKIVFTEKVIIVPTVPVSGLPENIVQKLDKLPDQMKQSVLKNLLKIQQKGYTISIEEDPQITERDNGRYTEYSITGKVVLSDNTKGFAERTSKDVLISFYKLQDVYGIQKENKKIKSFSFNATQLFRKTIN